MLKKPYVDFRSLKDTHSTQYDSFWNQQEQIRKQNLEEAMKKDKLNISELQRYKNDIIDTAVREAREYERSHGNSGNFFKDFKYGVKYSNKYIKPFNKYATPVLSKMGGTGQAVSSITSNASGIIDKL